MLRDVTYTRTAKGLHWGVAFCSPIVITLGLIITRVDLSLDATVVLYQLHKAIGSCVFVMMLLRILWRARHAPPAWPQDIPFWRRRIAHIIHGTLYLLLFALPMLGWLAVSAAPIPFPTSVFGLFEVPHLSMLAHLPYEQRLPWSNFLTLLHRLCAWLLIAVAVVHTAAALLPSKHKDALRGRMSLWSRRSHESH